MAPEERNNIKEMLVKIDDAGHAVEVAQRRYLQARGWHYSSSNNPGCYWMWEKAMMYKDRQIMMVASVDHAVHMQQRIDSLEGLWDDEEVDDG